MSALIDNFKGLASPSHLLKLWSYLRAVPGGGVVLGRLVSRRAPYIGTIRPEIVELERGHAIVRMADRASVRNHLRSVHAIALMNLGEAATGLAMLVSLPHGARGIVTHLGMDYLKKARGPLTAECTCPKLNSAERKEYEATGEVKNQSGELVARITARWLIGPAS